jgi:ribosomal protein S9
MAIKKTDNAAEVVRTPYDRKSKRSYTHAVGRRREAVARVRLHTTAVMWDGVEVKPGDILVNNKPLDVYFKDTIAKTLFLDILKVPIRQPSTGIP